MMNELFIVFGVVGFFALYLALSYQDAQKGTTWVAFFNGTKDSPFSATPKTPAAQSPRDTEIDDLRARIATLEKIVTEPAYELNQKINRL